MSEGNIKKLKSSWTKYDCVRVIEIIGDDDLELYLIEEEAIDPPVLKSYLGIKDYKDELPYYWKEVQKFPRQKRLFALVAGIFTHHENIKLFANTFSTNNMLGNFTIGGGGKHMTNLRSALVVSGAAKNSFRRKDTVPYDISNLFEEGELGIYFKDLLRERLLRVGYSEELLFENLVNICLELDFHRALSLSKDQFKRWMNGKGISQVKEFNYPLLDLLPSKSISALKVNQWLKDWDDIDFSLSMRTKPEPYFYVFNIDIRLLKRLSDIHRRRPNKKRSEDTSVQRGLDEKRSEEIKKYVKGGFPLSTLSESAISDNNTMNLKMPGILPTAIVANIIGPDERRGNNVLNAKDAITIEKSESGIDLLNIPEEVFKENWDPDLKPIEIIDGQHRLMAFDDTEKINGNYEVPVVAYYNLDRTWQAYLFYVINIKPKKINTSLGYDLYPLLRTQSWLENSKDGLMVYRETRAQELVEALWLYDQSAWHNRINMIGSNEGNNISQAAFIRALSGTYLKRSSRKEISGLFADVLPGKNFEEIKWVRAQQAAFLILLWEQISIHASSSNENWAIKLKGENNKTILLDTNKNSSSSLKIDDAFLSKNSMLSRDQGVTGISMITNDLFFVAANLFDDYDFNEIEWEGEIDERHIETRSIDKAIEQFRKSPINSLIKDVSRNLMYVDWRTPTAEFDSETLRDVQKKYKGTGGYKEVWKEVLRAFKVSNDQNIKKYALKLEELSNL